MNRPTILIAVTVTLGVFSTPPIWSQTLEPVDTLVVVDTTGKKLGPVIHLERASNRRGTPEVPFKFGEFVFVLRVLETRFVGGGRPVEADGHVLWFDGHLCDGQAFMARIIPGEAFPEGIVPRSVVGLDGGTVYVEDPDGAEVPSVDALSVLRVQENVVNCQDFGQITPTDPLLPTIALVNMFNHFTQPFSVQAEVKKGKGPKK